MHVSASRSQSESFSSSSSPVMGDSRSLPVSSASDGRSKRMPSYENEGVTVVAAEAVEEVEAEEREEDEDKNFDLIDRETISKYFGPRCARVELRLCQKGWMLGR